MFVVKRSQSLEYFFVYNNLVILLVKYLYETILSTVSKYIIRLFVRFTLALNETKICFYKLPSKYPPLRISEPEDYFTSKTSSER